MSKASQAAENALRNAESIQYGDFSVTKDWLFAANPLRGHGGANYIVFNPNDPTQKFAINDLGQLGDYLTLDGRKGQIGYDRIGDYIPGADPGARGAYESVFRTPSLEDMAESKRLQEISARVTSGEMSSWEAQQQANSGKAGLGVDNVYQRAYDEEASKGDSKYVELRTPDGKRHEVVRGSPAYDRYLAAGATEDKGGGIQSTIVRLPDGTERRVEIGSSAYQRYVTQGGSVTTPDGRTLTGSAATQYGSPSGTPSNTADPMPSTGDPALDATLGSLEEYIKELEKRGQVLNPNIVLDAKTLAQFTKQAEQEINPYYAGQLKMARESLLNSAGFSRDEVLRTEQQLEQQYQQRFRETGESAADRGFALSGIRQREEGQLATDTQRVIDSNRRKLEFDTGNAARGFAQQYGTSNMPTLNIGATPSITGGENKFSTNPGTRSLYQLDPGVYQGLVGSQEFEQRGAVRNRASQLEEAFRSNQALQQARSLTL